MNTEDVTRQILEAWDEEEPVVETPEGEPEDENLEEDRDQEETPEEPEEDEDEDEEEDDEEEDEEEEGEEQEAAVYDGDDPEVQAFLARYQGDVGKALRALVDQQKVIGRQGSEKAALAQRVAELEAAIEQAQAFNFAGNFINPEQAEWVEEAINSQNPGMYIQRAIQDGEFDLARAVAREWSRENPYDAQRAGQAIDQFEYRNQQAQVAPQVEHVDPGVLLDVLAENFPEMRVYEGQMVSVLSNLGAAHPLVIEAKTGDVQTAARAIISIYEIARASNASVRSAKDKLKTKHRQEADDVREAAQVSSGTASPSVSETPRRSRQIMPGLTLEDLDAEFATQ